MAQFFLPVSILRQVMQSITQQLGASSLEPLMQSIKDVVAIRFFDVVCAMLKEKVSANGLHMLHGIAASKQIITHLTLQSKARTNKKTA